jgi:quercetin dioxygenase-like cupin family protein
VRGDYSGAMNVSGESAFAELADEAPLRIWNGVRARAVHGERITLSVVELDPDSVIPEHAHEQEQVGMIVRGSLTFRIAAETRELRTGAAWRIRSRVLHEVRTGPEGAVVVEVFAPPRADWDALERDPPTPPLWPG